MFNFFKVEKVTFLVVLSSEQIGITQSSLERVGLSKGGVVLNKKCHISCGTLIRSKRKD